MTDKSEKELEEWINSLPVEDGAYYCLDEDGNKKYFVGNPIRGVTCNVHPTIFAFSTYDLDACDLVSAEVYKKFVESFMELPSTSVVIQQFQTILSGKDLTNERD